jgi:hypothetical protein
MHRNKYKRQNISKIPKSDGVSSSRPSVMEAGTMTTKPNRHCVNDLSKKDIGINPGAKPTIVSYVQRKRCT